MVYDQGKCSALLTREGFFDFIVLRTQCSVSHSVAVVCQHNNKVSLVFSNNMSDIKLSLVDGFYSLQLYASCDPGWFRVNDVCINFFQLITMNCQQHNGGQLAYHVLKNVTISAPGNILDKNTKLSLFFDMFHHMDDMNTSHREIFESLPKDMWGPFQRYFDVNGTDLCIAFNISHECTNSDIALSVSYRDFLFDASGSPLHSFHWTGVKFPFYFAMWSVIYQPTFQIRPLESYDYTLCEKSLVQNTILTDCSASYMSCNDGTCIHDSLVCDGHSHCPHGEDETNCQHICSDPSYNCMLQCHHRDLCFCTQGYFQCLSGGCVPLQKLCDKSVHCIDASDEPPTCMYLRPEQLSSHSLSAGINNYINTLIQHNIIIQHKCSQSNYGSLVHVQNVKYKIRFNRQKCLPSSVLSTRKMICGIPLVETWYHSSLIPRLFSLDRLCIYDHDCDDNYRYHCSNGFHLLKCEHMYCVGRFKCPSSYCMSFDHICNKVCDCPHCEDESICNKLLCPGMVLIEQLGSGLRCSMNLDALKHSMNYRQVIHRNDVNITDDFPVLIHLDDVMNLTNFIHKPEVVVYCEIRYYKFSSTDVSIFHHMISVRRLLLPHNHMQKVHDSMFVSMSQLIVIDLSHNLIKYLPQLALCSLHNLQYISLHHNLITELPDRIFVSNPHVQVLLLESNHLKPQSVTIDAAFPSLYRLSSDIPRLCCAFETVKFCSPTFPLYVTCSDLITSKPLIALGWLFGLSTSLINLVCLMLLVYKLCTNTAQIPLAVMVYSMNLNLAELASSLCILSYSIINVVYHDVFGIFADHWRHSGQCLILESLFSVSSWACLAFALCLSAHFAIHIPSVTPKESSLKAIFVRIIIMWLIIISTCITVQILEHMRNIDPFNYFCFPFTTLYPSDPLILGLQSVLLVLDVILIIATVISHSYLLVFIIRRSKNKTLQSVGKRKERLQKLAARLSVLILSTVLTWIPIICVQILVLLKITVLPSIYFWCILVSFPINLTIDPILLIRNLLA